ncbi:MAG: methyl-accepting chemotaxis protein [Neptuniibacter sp.]|nr:methyl-accepting chemotaxis protein [Neptuniibacter sp.]
MYKNIEKTFFNTLTKKIVGNVLFLVVPNFILVAAAFWLYLGLSETQLMHASGNQVDSHINDLSNQLYYGSVAALSFCLGSALFSIFFMRHLFLAPIKHMTEVLNDVEHKEGDISANLPTYTCDEISTMAESYNSFSNNLKQMIADTRQRSVKVALSASQLQKVIHDAKSSAQSQEEQAQKVFQASQEATQAIEGIAGNTTDIANRNDRNLVEIRTAGEEMSHVQEQMRSIESQVNDFLSVVQKLSENSENIIKVLTLVQDFSDQTNLLALNASIEAARAGEAGRGFSVVADEVRTLSQKVSEATQEIDSNIKQMVSLVGNTKSGASNIMQYVSETDQFITQVSDKFKTMIVDFEEVSGQMNNISAAIEELSYTNNNTHQHVTEITDISVDIKSEMEVSTKHSLELENCTEEMQELLSRFSIGFGGFETILGRAKDGANKIQDALEEMNNAGVNLFDTQYSRENPDQQPEKYNVAYTQQFEHKIQPLYDQFINQFPEFAIACAFDRNGYCPAHNSKISKPITGNFEVDNALSRHRRIYNANRVEQRRANQTSPFLLLTVIRDTGEILNSLSIPLYVNGKFWGNFCAGFSPELLLDQPTQ